MNNQAPSEASLAQLAEGHGAAHTTAFAAADIGVSQSLGAKSSRGD